MENIGARRLHTIMEKLLEDLSFDAPELEEKNVVINADYVNEKLGGIVKNRVYGTDLFFPELEQAFICTIYEFFFLYGTYFFCSELDKLSICTIYKIFRVYGTDFF